MEFLVCGILPPVRGPVNLYNILHNYREVGYDQALFFVPQEITWCNRLFFYQKRAWQ